MRRELSIDLRTALPVALLALVVLAIIVLELCGRSDASAPLAATTPRPIDRSDSPTAGPPAGTVTPGASPTAAPARTPTARPVEEGAAERDGIRQLHLSQLQDALIQFEEQEEEFPSSNGAVQTLCIFEDADAGCALRDVLDELPEDPLGLSTDNGYWYQSDGESFTVYARRESDEYPECDDHPDFLEDIDSLLCVSGP